MRAVVLEGDVKNWQDLLCALGDFGEFQPERTSGSLFDDEKKELVDKVDGILAQTKTWTYKLKLEETVGPIVDFIGPDKLEVEAKNWNSLSDYIESAWPSYAQRLQEMEKHESENITLFLSKVSRKLVSQLGLKVLKQLIELRSSLKNFQIFLTILSKNAAREVQSEMTKADVLVISESLGENSVLLLAYGSMSQTAELAGVAERLHPLNIDAFLLLMRFFNFRRLVEDASRTLHVLYSSQKFGESLVVTGYAPEQSLPTLRMRMKEIGFRVAEKPTTELPVYEKLPKLARNFTKIISMYSPTGASYSEIDPTVSVAITFPIFFGFMFGDVGQGIVLLLLGAYLSISSTLSLYNRGLWKYRDWGAILFLCGLSSSIFGLLYGEFFGVSFGLLGFLQVIDVRRSSMTEAFAKLALIAIAGGFTQLTLGMIFKAKNMFSQKKSIDFFHEIFIIATYILGFIYVAAVTGFLAPVNSVFSKVPYLSQIFLSAILACVIMAVAAEPVYRLLIEKADKIFPVIERNLQKVVEVDSTKHLSVMAMILTEDEAESVKTNLSQDNIETRIEPLDENRVLLETFIESEKIGKYQQVFSKIITAAREKLEQDLNVFHRRRPSDTLTAFFDLPNEKVNSSKTNMVERGISTEVKKVGSERSILTAYCPLSRVEILGYMVQQFGVGNLVMSLEIHKKTESEDATSGFIDFFIELIELASNTISYIRLAVLFLVHSLLLSILNNVFVLGLAALPIVVLGNIGIIALEGLVVFIQSLRLHFYEFFSKFFQGGGKSYSPVTTCSIYACIKWTRH
ncbi:MAG: V-type ATPase 116kDa subunit family protein [Candidatus Bathyarchaeota archaeon]